MLGKEDILIRKQRWDELYEVIRKFFSDRGFVEFQTPLLVQTPGMEPNLDPFEVHLNLVHPVEQKTGGLITSPEYSLKKLIGVGFSKIFSITPVFRNGEALGPHNTPEFMMLEWYAPGNYEDMMQETEELLNQYLGTSDSWPRILHENAGYDEFGDPHVVKEHFFITNFPAKEASLARLAPGGETAERFEAYANGLELCNGYAELTDPVEQRKRFEQEQFERKSLGKTVFPIDEEFLEGLGRIKGPIYGNSIGLDRLIMLKYRVGDINDIQLFPANDRWRNHYGITK
ncbi:MAG: amino acid--tRNA ligase-related protein [Patescibacteria group bacterium]|jgi:lysyl-tRNA synthetase class 2